MAKQLTLRGDFPGDKLFAYVDHSGAVVISCTEQFSELDVQSASATLSKAQIRKLHAFLGERLSPPKGGES